MFRARCRTVAQSLVAKTASRATKGIAYGALLRAVGLDALNSVFPSLFTDSERPKFVSERSFSTALQRCGMHLLPVAVSIVLIVLNLRGYFIGSELAGVKNEDNVKLGAIQIAAKIQELLIVGSLASTVFSLVRHELTAGKGLPFGLIASGFEFPNLSFYWSSAFIGSVRSGNGWRRGPIITLLIVTGLLAVTAGPSSAVLMVPSQQTWSGGWTQFFLNGTDDDLWPTTLTTAHIGLDAWDLPRNGTSNPYGIAGGLQALRYWSSTLNFVPGGSATIGPLYHLSVTDSLMQQTMSGYIRQPLGLVQYKDTWAEATHSATAIVQERMRQAWQDGIHKIGGSYGRLKYGNSSASRVSVQIPAVRVICTPPTFLHPGSSALSFPVLKEYASWANQTRDGTLTWQAKEMQFQSNFSHLWNSLDSQSGSDNLQSAWVSLGSEWGSVSAGLAIFDPSSAQRPDRRRLGMGCSVDARWAQGDSVLTRGTIGGDFEKWSAVARQRPGTNYQEFGPVNDGSYRRISLSMEWLGALTPTLSQGSPQGNSLEKIGGMSEIIAASGLNQLDASSDYAASVCTVFIEHIVSVVVANGISRVGLARQVDMNTVNILASNYTYATASGRGDGVLDPQFSTLNQTTNFTRLVMTETTEGYAIVADSVLDYLAITVLCTHILIALCHSLILLFTRTSSASWTNLPELLALSQNSKQAPVALQNTCAGIHCLETYGQKAVIASTTDEPGHLEIIFLKDQGALKQRRSLQRLAVGEKYGHLRES